MKRKKMNKKVISWIVVILVAIGAIAGTLQWRYKHGNRDEETAETETPEPSASAITYINDPEEAEGEYVLDESTIQSLRDELAADQALNGDVQGILYFESGMIHQPVLKGTDNDYYLYHNWQTGEYDPVGNITMDAWNDINKDDMNTIIYGHYVYPSYSSDRTLMFTQLALLMDQSNYEANKYIAFVTSGDIRYYEISVVFEAPLETIDGVQYPTDDMQYNLENYDSAYFSSYMEQVKAHAYYETDVDINYGDRFMTLQTCIEGDDNDHEIVLCKELGRNSYNS